MNKIINATLLAALVLMSFSTTANLIAGVWDTELVLPAYDPLWQRTGELQKNFREIKALENIISIAEKLRIKYPKKPEPYLWLAWAYNQKALRCDCSREEQRKLYRKGIEFAWKAYSINKDKAAFRIFAASTAAFSNFDEMKKEHSVWIKEASPLPEGRALPEMTGYPEWRDAVRQWDRRSDIKKGSEALKIFRSIAEKNRGDILAQLWAGRACYYLGSYFIETGRDEKANYYFAEGARFGERAVGLDPMSLPANYWYFLNFGRTMENAGIIERTLSSKRMLKYLMFCFRENMTYFYYGPAMIAAGAIARGGWLTRNIMEMLGYRLDDLQTVLDLAAVLYPNYFRIQSCRAEIFYSTGRTEEAKNILASLLKRDPEENKIHSAENRVVLMAAKNLLKKIENGGKK